MNGFRKRTSIRDFSPMEIADARKLYFGYAQVFPKQIKEIVSEMQLRGWAEFTREDLTGGRNGDVGLIAEMNWAAAKRALELEANLKQMQRAGFRKWLVKTFPAPEWKWRWKYQVHVYRFLRKLTSRGGARRLMIMMPPRHGKSELVTIRYSAWRLLCDPRLRIVVASYNQRLANKFSRRIKQIVHWRPGVQSTEGLRIPNAMDEWETGDGGGVRALGVGGGVTGYGAQLVVIDDPVKNRAQAESQTYRDNTWDWFNDDIYTRLEPGAAVILIQTRWHEDDLAGRLLKEAENGGEPWEVISLPALAEDFLNAETQRRGEKNEPRIDTDEHGIKESLASIGVDPCSSVAEISSPRLCVSALKSPTDPLGRLPGRALCPERYDEAALDRIRKKLGSYSFSALYQQRPVPSEGGLFKRDWFKKIVDRAPEGLSWVRGYDLAVSTRESADYTASFRCAMDKGIIYIADGFRARIEFPEQRKYIVERLTEEKTTRHGIEAALHGRAVVQELQREMRFANRSIKAIRVDTDKTTRAHTWSSRAEDGKVVLVRGPWIDEFLDEVCRFPHGKHDDQVDAVSLAVQMLATDGGKKAAGF